MGQSQGKKVTSIERASRRRSTIVARDGGFNAPSYVEPQEASIAEDSHEDEPSITRLTYARPAFLLSELSQEDIHAAQDSKIRKVLSWVNKGGTVGYAEVINAGKSSRNEDQAMLEEATDGVEAEIRGTFLGIFDGHGGWGSALYAAQNLHYHIYVQLRRLAETELFFLPPKLVCAALEQSFVDCDESLFQFYQDCSEANLNEDDTGRGGCTALIAILLRDHLFIANAGDCRAVMCIIPDISKETTPDSSQALTTLERVTSTALGKSKVEAVSNDHTPESDRQRIQLLCRANPSLLGKSFNRRIFIKKDGKPLTSADVNQYHPCADYHVSAPVRTIVTPEDVKTTPVIVGSGKTAKLMGKIGTSRGFGDFDLISTGLPVKALLTPTPEVRAIPLPIQDPRPNMLHFLVLASDGFWDAVSNDDLLNTLESFLRVNGRLPNGRWPLARAAAFLVTKARGSGVESTTLGSKKWLSGDDISLFILDLAQLDSTPVVSKAASNPSLLNEVSGIEEEFVFKEPSDMDSSTKMSDTSSFIFDEG